MNKGTQRLVLRWIHLVFTIPVLGYIYQPAAQVEQYAGAARLIFVPVLMATGYWMYAGVGFAIISVAVWLGAFSLSGFGAALLSQVLLLIGRRIWLMVHARKSKGVVQ